MALKAELNSRLQFSPLVAIAISFISGVILAHYCPINFIYLSVFLSILFFLNFIALKNKFWGEVLLLFMVFSVGALDYQNSRIISENNITNFISDTPRTIWLKGKVVSAIELRDIPGRMRKSTFNLRVLTIEDKGTWVSISGKIRTTLFMEKPYFEFGDILVLRGEISRARDAELENEFSYKEYLRRQGIYGLLKVKADSLVVLNRSRSAIRYIYRLRERFRKIINHTLIYPQRTILTALLLGDRVEVPEIIKDSFIKTGTVHILAISGLHVGLISYIFYLFLKILRIPRRFSYFILIFLIMGYAILAGSRAPVVRATIMAVVYLVGLFLRRQHQILNSLALACLLVLIFNPQQLFNAGFQLSFLSVLAIVALTPLIESYFLPKSVETLGKRNRWVLIQEKAKRYGIRSMVVSLSAWLGILPIVGYYFKLITPISILANLLVIPLAFLILAIGFITLLCGLFSLGLAHIFAYTNLLAINSLINVTTLLSRIPFGAFSTKIFSFPYILIYYLVLAILSFLKRIKKHHFALEKIFL